MTHSPLPRAVQRLRLALAADEATPDAELLRRYRDHRDSSAFEALIRRHGPGVLSACRRVLSDPADVEDAFQAAFLVFLRDAQSVRRGQAVGAWLYGVAHRVALRARAARRRRGEVEAGATGREPDPPPDLSWREACAVLHEELDRLPEKYRLPLMLCYLEGLSRDEAAGQLGLSLNAIRNRLEQGRSRLRARLSRRGITLSAGLLAALPAPAVLALSPALVRSALAVARPSARVIELAGPAGGVGAIKAASALALAAGLLVGVGLGGDALRAGATPKEMPAEEPPAKPAAQVEARQGGPKIPENLAVKGRVLDPEGRPVKGAKVWLLTEAGAVRRTEPGSRVMATTDADGAFAFAVDGKGRRRYWTDSAQIVATADGFGLAWVTARGAKDKPLQLKLVKDEPVAGRILTLEGKPVAGAKIRVVEVSSPAGPDLSGWLADLKAKQQPLHAIQMRHFHYEGRLGEAGGPLPGQPEAIVTDAEGRFRITGIGRERLVDLRIEGPGIATVWNQAVTRPIPTLTVMEDPGDSRYGNHTYYGAAFDFAAQPGQPFEGVVTDRETGKPVAGVTVRGRWKWHELPTVTDKDGKYRLSGLEPGPHELIAFPTPDQPYHRMAASGGGRVSQEPARVDFALTRGHWVTGKVVNARTSKPEAGASVWYRPVADEPAYESVPGARVVSQEPATHTAQDGSFRVLAFPCRGGIVVSGFSGEYIGADQRAVQGDVDSLDRGMRFEDILPTSPALVLVSYHAAAIVNVDPNKPRPYTITLDPGVTVKAKVVDKDGKPVEGVEVGGQSTWGLWSHKPAGPEVEITQFNPDRPRAIVFLHPGRQIGKVVVPKQGDGGPWTVTLEPTATVTGRLVSEDGRPIANAVIRVDYLMPGRDIWTPSFVHERVRTDDKGMFKLTNLVAGLTYSLDHAQDQGGGRRQRHYVRVQPKAGEARDLGDLRPAGE
jgi:RNA polymerase sigma factor (sigma-70 family)